MIQPLGKFIFVKRYATEESKIIIPDNARTDDSTLFVVESVGPEVKNIFKDDIVIMFSNAVAQQIHGGYVCNSETVCALIK